MPKDEAPSVESLAFAQGRPFGEGLRAAREHLGVSLEDVSDETKIRRHYLNALEEMNLAQLPSRPFTEGYARAYARYLGLDEHRAIARFRQDWPLEDEALPEPVGVTEGPDPRIAVVATAGALVILAIVIWNIATRAMADRAPPRSAEIAEAAPLPPAPEVVELGQPMPPPVEATLPPPYITPGLEPEGPGSSLPVATGAPVSMPPNEAPRPFQVKGKTYGSQQPSRVVLQAVNSVFVILRGRDDSVLEIQELEPGDAYRAPTGEGLALDVTAPSSVEVFVDGQFKGRLTQSVTKINALAPKAAPVPQTPLAPAQPAAPPAPVAAPQG